MAKSRYDELLTTLQSKGWSQAEIEGYVANFNGIYEEVCRSITRKASTLGRSGLEVNREYLRILSQLKNEMAAVATERVIAGKPMTFYTDTDRGPQGDLFIALKNTNSLKNFLTDPKRKAINNGYPGVKIPLANTSPSAKQYEDEYAIGPKQLFCVLDRDGVKGVDVYLQELTSNAIANPKTKAAAVSGMYMFADLANAAIMDRALEDQAADEAQGISKPIEEYTQAYDGFVKYAKTKYLQDATAMLANGDVYYFGFADGKPAMNLGESVKGTIFDPSVYKTNKPMTVYAADYRYPHTRHLNIQENAFLKEKPATGTCCLGLTRENLTISGFNPIDQTTLQFLSEHYTKTELAAIVARHTKYAAQKGIKPIAKKYPIKTQTVAKPSVKTIESLKQKPRTHVYMPTGTIPALKPIESQARSSQDTEGLLVDASKAKSNYALAQLQKTVKSDMRRLGGLNLTQIRTYVGNYLFEEVPGISDNKVTIYENIVSEKIYEIIRERIEETGKAELKFGKKGPIGDLKVALDNAYADYSKVFKGIPEVDFSDMKGFNMGESQEEVDSPKHPTGDMTIEADGKITVKENANSPRKTQDGGQAQ